MLVEGPCLYRTGFNLDQYQVIKLEGAQVTVGSSCFETFTILSPVISPRHAVLRQYGNSWAIEDTYSTRGVLVNGQRLIPNSPRTLKNGDLVQFGFGLNAWDPHFVYKFLSSAVINVDRFGNVSVPSLQRIANDQARRNALQEHHDDIVNELNNINLMLIDVHEDLGNQLQKLKTALEKSRAELDNLAIKIYGKSLRQKMGEESVIQDVMDSKLQCSICFEYFIQATVLNCTHVFCKFCINKWMSFKENCPNCRRPISYQVQIPSLDQCIKNMVDQLGYDVRRDRAAVLKQREADLAMSGLEQDPTIRRLLIVARDKAAEILVALIRAAERTRDIGYTGAGMIREALEHPETHLQTFRMSAELHGAAALAKVTTLKRAVQQKAGEALKKAAILKREEALARAKAMKKTALLMRAGARKGKDLMELTKNAAYNGARIVQSSDLYKNISEVLSKFVKKGSDINEAVVTKVASALRRGAFLKTGLVAKAKAAHKAVVVMKRAALVKAAEIKRRAAIMRASAIAKTAAFAGKVSGAATRTKQAAISISQGPTATAARNTAVDLLNLAVVYISSDAVIYNCLLSFQSGRSNIFMMLAP